jgi:hypothetical protein
VPLDDRIQELLTHAGQEIAGIAAEERAQAAAQAAEAAAADVRQSANAQLAEIRASAQKQTEELKRAAETQIADLRAALAEAERHAQSEIEDARRLAHTQVDDVQRTMSQKLTDLQQRLADTEARLNGTRREMEQLVATAAEQERNRPEPRLRDAVRVLDDAGSLGQVLELLAQQAGREADRAAIFVVRGNQAVGWTFAGFGNGDPAPRSVALGLDAAGLVGDAVRTAAAASTAGTDTDQREVVPSFAREGGPRDAVALPVVVGGAVVAVLYADAAPRQSNDRWSSTLEVLARHASSVLEALTVQQAVGLSLPRRVVRASHDAVAGSRHDRSVQ